MDELRESSLLFSLEGLLETERERVQREAREAQKRRDDELIRSAAEGTLSDPSVLEQQARRMLRSPKAKALSAKVKM